jgi:hypothetical protein
MPHVKTKAIATGRVTNRAARMAAKVKKICAGANPRRNRKAAENVLDKAHANVQMAT